MILKKYISCSPDKSLTGYYKALLGEENVTITEKKEGVYYTTEILYEKFAKEDHDTARSFLVSYHHDNIIGIKYQKP